MMYAAPEPAHDAPARARSTSRRRPGCARPARCPGMFALESAMDELASPAALDPIELRDPQRARSDPETRACRSARATSSPACARAPSASAGPTATRARASAATAAGWSAPASPRRPTRPAPARRRPPRASPATAVTSSGSRAADIGTGARTALTQIAADALGVAVERVRAARSATATSRAPSVAGGSSGTSSWGSAVVGGRARRCATSTAATPADGARGHGHRRGPRAAEQLARHAFGAQFAEARVDVDTGEIRVPRCSASSPPGGSSTRRTARSQFIGGMTMGLSMALHEESVRGPRVRRLRQPRLGRSTTSPPRRRRATSRRLDRRGRPAPQPDGRARASARSASSAPPRRSPTPSPRHRRAGPRPADPP